MGWIFAMALVPLALSQVAGHEINIVSPTEFTNVEGDQVVAVGRFQQIFPSHQFTSLPDGHRLLTQIALRPDGSQRSRPGARTTKFNDLEIRLSANSLDYWHGLAQVFAENVENPETVVHKGPLTITAEVTGPDRGPKDFVYEIPLQTPFLLKPDAGILMDWASSSNPLQADGFIMPVGMMIGGSATDTTGDYAWGGNVFQFTFSSEKPEGPPLQAGDADQDLDFDQLDLVRVQVAAKYLTGQPATWGQGDWNGAPGGNPGSPPSGDGLFNQRDIVAAQQAGLYLRGRYSAVSPNGQPGDGQTSVIYNVSTGEVGVDAPAGVQLTSINIDSARGIFTGAPAQNLGGSFDNDSDTNIFKATFGSSFGSISFGRVAALGLSRESLLSDLTVVGSLAGGGALGNVDLIYVPEPATFLLAVVSLVAFASAIRKPDNFAFGPKPTR
jgi:hypothetical protein